MQKFELLLKNEKQRLYDRLTVFIVLLNVAAISWCLFPLNQSIPRKVTGGIALLLLIIMLYNYSFAKLPKRNDVLLLITASVTVIYWLSLYWWTGIIAACLFLLHFINKRKLTVRFYPDRIEYPSFPKRIIKWDELSNVILKDDWLTIDFKNNRIIQQFSEESIIAGNEKEFNDFCRQLLKK